jgi:hypothetical protein
VTGFGVEVAIAVGLIAAAAAIAALVRWFLVG